MVVKMHRTQKLLKRSKKQAQKISFWKENTKRLRNCETTAFTFKLKVCIPYNSERKKKKSQHLCSVSVISRKFRMISAIEFL